MQKVYSMREENNSEFFDHKKAITVAQRSNFGKAMEEVLIEELL
ncbi:hypothetical protein MTBBW1_2720007 [Desulfamplus magnetovallimortis]|uniref:Uncharacterized protein n=1 Tax=Desulfamplus magnetovallimortis TaxID=1246637 RepID=A0A1W1HF80_9BACT|nr:hypothetical protein MTBBW1_2720007 [Desulfamplus magnetovallimortis]